MRINHNVMSANVHRLMKNTNSSFKKSIEKLSSGSRINRAGDDAAGLSISEKMRAQIRGLKQASRNSQDSISFIQTAEAAAGNMHEILQRMRELSIQSGHGVLTDDDRNKIQSEVDELVSQVDKIATETEFNTQKVFDDENDVVELVVAPVMSEFEGIPQGTLDHFTEKIPTWLNDSLIILRDNFGIDMPDSPIKRPMEVEYYFDDGPTAPGASMGTADGGASLKLRINLGTLTDGSGDPIDDEILDGLVAHEMMHGITFTEMAFATTVDPDPIDEAAEIWFIEGLAMLVQGGNNFDGTPVDDTVDISGAWTGSNTDYKNAFAAMKLLHEQSPGGIAQFIDRLEQGDTLDQAFNGAFQNSTLGNDGAGVLGANYTNVNDFIAFASGLGADDYYNNSTDFQTGTGAITDGHIQGSYTDVDLASTIPNGTSTSLLDTHFDLDFLNSGQDTPPEPEVFETMTFQIGANQGQSMAINKQKLSVNALNLEDVDLSNQVDAESSISVIDDALEKVSRARSYYGAIQNRLEYTIKNLDRSSENLKASESRIRDVDMAKEMMNQSKLSILMSATQSMLVQANQAPQSVISLLR